MHREEVANSSAVVVPVVLPELTSIPPSGPSRRLEELGQIELDLTVVAGKTQLSLDEAKDLEIGSIVTLDRSPQAAADLLVNGVHAGSADVIVIDEELAARIADLSANTDQI